MEEFLAADRRSPRSVPAALGRDLEFDYPRERLTQRLEHIVGARRLELIRREVAARHPDADRARAVGGRDVERRVPNDEHAIRIDLGPEQDACSLDRLARQLRPVSRVRAVAAEREPACEIPACELDVCDRVGPAGREPEEVALVYEPWQQLRNAVEHAVSLRLGERL